MVLTFKQLKNVAFPIYSIKSDNWSYQDGLLKIDTQIVDDRNMPGKTLGIRRLQSPFKNLYPLKHQIDGIVGILKNKNNKYIDSKGRIFLYEKTTFATLEYYKIKKIVKKETACVLWLHSVNFPFIIPRPPDPSMEYAGVLHLSNLPWILYEYSERKQKSSRRKV